MPAIINLCQRAILLDTGRVVVDGQSKDVVQHYLATVRSASGEVVWSDLAQAPGNDIVRLQAVRIFQDGIEEPTADVDISKEVRIQIRYQNLQPGTLLYTAIILKDQMGTIAFASSSHKSISLIEDPWYGRPQPIGFFQSVCRIPSNFLNEGFYNVSVIVGKVAAGTQILEDQVLSFQVHDTREMRKEFYGGWVGVVRPKLDWKTDMVSISD